MNDYIIHITDFPAFEGEVKAINPDYLRQDDAGNVLTDPPVVVGVSRTNAVFSADGTEALAYCRGLPPEWEQLDSVTVLAEAPYDPAAPGDAVYQQIFDDPAKLEVYDRIYDRTPYSYEDPETGESITVTPPDRFGVIG